MTSMMNEGGRIHEEHKEQLTTVNILNKVEGCLERVKRFVIKLPSANDLTKILTSLERMMETFRTRNELMKQVAYMNALSQLDEQLTYIYAATEKYNKAGIKGYQSERQLNSIYVILDCTYLQKKSDAMPNEIAQMKNRIAQMNEDLEKLKHHQVQVREMERDVEEEDPQALHDQSDDQEQLQLDKADLLCLKGDCAFFGHGCPINYALALQYYHEACKFKSPKAYLCLARIYESGLGVKINPKRSYFFYRKAYEMNDPTAAFSLGKLYENDKIAESEGKTDIKDAKVYYEKAAELDSPDGLTQLGYMHYHGIEYPINKQFALELWQKAAEYNHALALNYIGTYHYNHQNNYKKAFGFFKKAAEMGSARALSNLGMCYEFAHGIDRNIQIAFQLYTESAYKKYIGGMTNLGYLYFRGEEYEKAALWFRNALLEEKNLPEANYYMGLLFEKGQGVEKDYYTAFAYYQKACSGNNAHAKAVKRCGDFMYSGVGMIRPQKAEAFKFYKRAAQLGDGEAYNSMGLMYEKGFDQNIINYKEAYNCYRQGDLLACSDATRNIGFMYINVIYIYNIDNIGVICGRE